jgi:hypothetical protein
MMPQTQQKEANTMNINARRDMVRNLIDSAGSTFVGVEYVSKSGNNRVMNVQTHAGKSLLKGDAASNSAKRGVVTRAINNPNLMNVYDVANNGWRSINLDTVTKVTVRGSVYVIDTNPHHVVKD